MDDRLSPSESSEEVSSSSSPPPSPEASRGRSPNAMDSNKTLDVNLDSEALFEVNINNDVINVNEEVATEPDVSARDPEFQTQVKRGLLEAEQDPLSKKELYAWYGYDWANSVYSSAGISGYLPLLLNELAKKAAGPDCHVPFGALSLRPATISTTFISFSAIFQFFSFLFFGAMADYGNLKRFLLGVTGCLGAALTICVAAFYLPEHWIGVGVILILTNILYGTSKVFYNAYLPIIVKATPDVWRFGSVPTEPALRENEEKYSNRYSTYGYMAGYGAAVILLLVTIGIAFGVAEPNTFNYQCSAYGPKVMENGIWHNSTSNTTYRGVSPSSNTEDENYTVAPSYFSDPDYIDGSTIIIQEPNYEELSDPVLAYRISLAITGIWWLLFTIPVVLLLRNRAGPSLPQGKNYFTASFSTIGTVVREARRYPDVLRFLIAYFIYTESYTSISTIALVFASEEFQSGAMTLSLLLVEVPLFALLGTFTFERIRLFFRLRTKTMLYIHLVSFQLLCIYCLIGFIPGSPFGLVHEFELYIVGAFYGLHIGAIQTFSRSLYAMMVPRGREAIFFSIFELSDKGSSWISPLVIAGINQATGSMRFGLLYVLIIIFIAYPLVSLVRVSRGVEVVVMRDRTSAARPAEKLAA